MINHTKAANPHHVSGHPPALPPATTTTIPINGNTKAHQTALIPTEARAHTSTTSLTEKRSPATGTSTIFSFRSDAVHIDLA